jgi:predicted heme/steroid binding protein
VERTLVTHTDLGTGRILQEEYFLGRWYHRDPKEGPAYIARDGKTGVAVWEWYGVRGHKHRLDGPAKIKRTPGGVVFDETWACNGRVHRDPLRGPARIEREPTTGRVMDEYYIVHGQYHRENGPAYIAYERDHIISEVYYRRGKRHRVDAPALVLRDWRTGVVHREAYYLDGICRRESEGPALIERDLETGGLVQEQFWENGVAIRELHYEGGRFHRSTEKGPAIIVREPGTGNVIERQYWLKGRRVAGPTPGG